MELVVAEPPVALPPVLAPPAAVDAPAPPVPVGTIPSAFRMEMQNVGAGSRTVVDFTDIKYNLGLADDLFTQRALERGQ